MYIKIKSEHNSSTINYYKRRLYIMDRIFKICKEKTKTYIEIHKAIQEVIKNICLMFIS